MLLVQTEHLKRKLDDIKRLVEGKQCVGFDSTEIEIKHWIFKHTCIIS